MTEYERTISDDMGKMKNNVNQTDGVPVELLELLSKDKKAREFFETLAKSYKKGYSDWIGSAKQEETRRIRAEKALKMLQNGQKTLKT